MALRGTATHRKIRRLAKRLSIDPCFALGIMEAIWHTTAEQQPDGGIGRLTNEDIADEIFYTGDADFLVRALIAEKLVDEIDGCRLYIHDWHEWADDSVISKLVTRTERFANGGIPRLTKYSSEYRAKISARYEAENFISVRNVRTVRVPVPEPVPVPVPEPEPEPEGGAHNAQPPPRGAAISIRSIPPDTEQRIRRLADDCPDQQDLPVGIDLAMQAVIGSLNPTATITAMEKNLPLWWEAMRDGRAKIKQFRWVVKDSEYLRKPREPTTHRHRKSPDLSRITEGL